jgi:hypothetical protein
MLTLSELEQVEQNKLERAARYERAKNDVYRLTRMIEQLGAKAPSVAVLQQIAALVPQVPEELRTHGSRFVAGGFVLRTMLEDMIGGCLLDAQAKATKVEKAIATTKKDLAAAEKRLAEFTN